MTPQQQESLDRIDQATEKATRNPNTLYKISNGFYVFYDTRQVVDVLDYHWDGIPEWMLKARSDNNWMGSYPTLKSIIEANELVRGK